MTAKTSLFARFAADEGAATAIEYGLILGLMVVAIVASLSSVGESTNDAYSRAAAGFPSP